VSQHDPVEEQQAPVGGCGQGLGEQSVPAPCHVFGEVQAASIVTEHEPDDVQQAP
jgi:hypothetical protein